MSPGANKIRGSEEVGDYLAVVTYVLQGTQNMVISLHFLEFINGMYTKIYKARAQLLFC